MYLLPHVYQGHFSYHYYFEHRHIVIIVMYILYISCPYPGNEPGPVADHVKVIYEETRYKASQDDWPPEQPQHFTSVTIIYHRRSRNKREILAVAGVKKSGIILDNTSQPCNQEPSQEYMAQSRLTKSISEIFEPLEDTDMRPPRSILIEGAPGIGKTILSKEIAYQWAIGDKKILQDKKMVFLIYMRDPAVSHIKSVENLVHSFYKNDPTAKDFAASCGRYLVATEGSELAIILDGYDEMSEELRNNSLFSDIVNRKVLPKCVLVITSRPSASAHLHNNMERRMEILGFSEADRKDYIQYALKGLQDQIQGLLKFLESHPAIDSLCYIPLNMTILIYLMKHRELSTLPTSQTNLYQDFVCLTICHHLKKIGTTLRDITDLKSFPDPYRVVISKLAKLSYTALDKSKLVFTSAEIREACPEISSIPGAIDGFGLLQAVEHNSTMETTLSYNFVHFSIQEYLAAFYISSLEDDEELKVLQERFWTGSHHNTWVVYTGITKGQKVAFKKFLCGGKPDASTISLEFLETSRKCLHLFECFDEAEDYKMCHQIDQAQVFNGRINTSMRTLTPRELKSLCVFLTKTSIKQWNELSLSSCIIGDTGCSAIEMALSKNAPTIESVRFEDNQLTALSTEKVIKIATYCNTILLDLRWNEFQDGEWSALIRNTSLVSIVLDECNLKVVGTKKLAAAVAKNKTLTSLRLDKNEIRDEAVEALVAMLAENTSLANLRLCGNPLTEKGVTTILKSLVLNRALQWLWLPHISNSKEEELHKQEDEINTHRLNNKCYVKLTVSFFD